MKKLIAILFLFVLFSCDTFFHENDNPYLSIDKEQEKIDIVNGIYTRLVRVHNNEYFSILSRSDDVTDYTNHNFSYANGSCGTDMGPIDYPAKIGDIYVNLYTAILNINHLLPILSDNNDKILLGEIYFLRAYCYFKLARLFGTPALVEDDVINYYLEKPSYKDVYRFIEQDMLKSLELLPETYTDSRIPGETPHKGTAKALLAEIYLAMAGYPVLDDSKYAEAARLSGEVIQEADSYNFALLPDFAALWKGENMHNSENIFGLFFSSKTDKNYNTIGNIHFGTSYNYDTKNRSIYIYSNYCPTFKFFDTFPDNYRKYNTFITGKYSEYTYQLTDTVVHGLHFTPFNPQLDPCTFESAAVCLKWSGDVLNFKNEKEALRPEGTLYLLRYAQTLLTYAEAKARSGHPDQLAYDVVNKIRRRANHLDLNTPSKFDLPAHLSTEQFIDSVVWERAWELAFEPDGRWFDIIRLNLKDNLPQFRYENDQLVTIPETDLTDEWYFYQIPQEDRWANPNLK